MDNVKQMKRARQRGMTLAEVLVATAVFTIIVVAALLIYDQSNKIFNRSVNSADMQQNTRIGFDRLVTEVRMAGYDYDRDGVPSKAAAGPWQAGTMYAPGAVVSPTVANGFTYQAVTGGVSGAVEPATWPTTAGETLTGDGSITWRALGPVYQQPDEQIEFAGKSAITIRANLDYSTDIANEHGRETAYEPAGGAFPIVTTANDEIVTYALRSDRGSNPDTLRFYADVSRPRSAFPGGSAETLVEIPNVDLCASGCNNPPYTLYRFTLDANGAPDAGTPIANNIKSLTFNYYTDTAGTTLLTQFDGTAVANGAIGGLGQYDPGNVGGTTNWNDRVQRSRITSIAINLQGMTNAPTLDDRTYTLAANVTPRNLGLSGMSEPSTAEPGPPSMRSVCAGSCNVTRVAWAPPITGNVRTYEVRWDTNASGTYNNIGAVVPGDIVSAPVFNLDPGTTYYFKVVAVNENGRSPLALVQPLSRSPVNTTRPGPASNLAATSGAAAQPNQITLTWTAPGNNASPLNTLSCAGVAMSGATIDPAEPIRYRVWRGASEDFDPTAGEGEVVLDNTVASQPTGPAGSTITWVDDVNNAHHRPPANCKNYYYRIQVYDTCSLNASDPDVNEPDPASTGESSIFPALGDDAILGVASSTTTPAAPGQPRIDYTNNNSECVRTSNTCDVKLMWPAVTTDMSNPTQTITVDQYLIRRERKKASDVTWNFDTMLPLVENASSDPTMMSGTDVVYHDTTALDHDPQDRRKWYYRYTIQALQCGIESAASPAVTFPETCGLAGSAVIQSGSPTGDGSIESPWVMNASDSVEVIAPANVALDRVEFELFPEPDTNINNAALDRQVVGSGPFIYSWNDQSDGALYRLVITMTNSQGCTEQTERFIQDDPIGCPSATISQNGASSGGGTDASPWFFTVGDTVTVNQPANATISSVTFTLFENPGSTVVGTPTTDATAPFAYSWVDQTNSQEYRLQIDVTYADGCTETIERFIVDEPPPVCNGATTTITGASGSGDGLTQATPWLVNGGDILTVVRPSGSNVISVVFNVVAVSPAGSSLPATTDTSAPYELTWSDQTDNTIYRITATVNYANCLTPETITRYVQDQICAGATTSASGSVGAGTGLTSVSPWVFNGGDTVTVNPPSGTSITSVQFQVYDSTGTSLIATTNDALTPFVFTWTDRVDDTKYQLKITVTYSAGCVETITRWIQDQGSCFVTVSGGGITHSDSGSQRIAKISYQVRNPSTSSALTIRGIKVGWTRDAGHPLANLTNIEFTSGATTATFNVPTADQDPPDTAVQSVTSVSPPQVPADSSSYVITLVFDIGKKQDVLDLVTNWVNSMCLQYTSADFSGTASCNVLGSTTGNPSACN